MNTRNVGNLGENIASKFLLNRNYAIIARNYRSLKGEIDIISIKDKTLHFIEVKLRKNTAYGYAHQAVNYKKQQKIKSTAMDFISKNDIYYEEISFDIIEIYTDDKLINYMENVF